MKKIGIGFGIFIFSSLYASVIRIPDDYPTIQMGIDSAAPYDTISIAADSFHECIEIYKPLTIIGAGMDSTVITPPDSQLPDTGTGGWPQSYDWNIHIKADSVEIMEISQYGSVDLFNASPSKVGIRVDSSNEISINSCSISGNQDVPGPVKTKVWSDSCGGIFLFNSSNLSITESKVIHNATLGVKGYNVHGIFIQDNDISHNYGSYGYGYGGGSGYGIAIDKCESCVVTNNTLSRNNGGYAGGWGYGILANGCKVISLTNNKIHYIGGALAYSTSTYSGGSAYGIKADSCEDVSVANNRIFHISGGSCLNTYGQGGVATGISLTNVLSSEVKQNSIVDINGGNQLSTWAGSGYGIFLSGSSGEIVYNTISGARGGWGWAIGPPRVYGNGIGIKCWSDSCIIERNAIVDNQLGIWSNATNVSIEECNFYFNTYQRYPTTPEDNYEFQSDSFISAKNNFWWYTDSVKIDSLIDGPADFVPFTIAPIESAPGEPSAVASVKIFNDTGYSIPFTSPVEYNDYLYIELQGTDWNNHYIDPAIVIITSNHSPLGIGVATIETDTASGVYRGWAEVDTISNDVWNKIGANLGDTIIVCANVDSTQCDTVIVKGPGVEETDYRLQITDCRLEVYPNPFTQKTEIRFQIPDTRYQNSDIRQETSNISLTIHDISGRLIREFPINDSKFTTHEVTWDGQDKSGKRVSSGIYFCILKTPDFKQIEKLVILK